jgi:hypothetical protein
MSGERSREICVTELARVQERRGAWRDRNGRVERSFSPPYPGTVDPLDLQRIAGNRALIDLLGSAAGSVAGSRVLLPAAAIQRAPPAGPAAPEDRADPAKADEKAASAGEVITEGLKTVADKAKDDPKVKKEIIEPFKKEATRRWGSLSGGDKAATVAFGAATYGLSLGALLSDPKGRETLAGLNLVLPANLVPEIPLTGFSYKLPKPGDTDRLIRFKLKFSGDGLLDRLRERYPDLPPLSVSFGMEVGHNVDTDRPKLLGGQASVQIFDRFGVSGGTFDRPPPLPTLHETPGGGFAETRKVSPQDEGPLQPGFQVMLTVKLKPGDLERLVKRIRRSVR